MHSPTRVKSKLEKYMKLEMGNFLIYFLVLFLQVLNIIQCEVFLYINLQSITKLINYSQKFFIFLTQISYQKSTFPYHPLNTNQEFHLYLVNYLYLLKTVHSKFNHQILKIQHFFIFLQFLLAFPLKSHTNHSL